MLHHPTVERLHELRLFGMAAALADQQSQNSIDQLGFEERLGLLVEREASERQSRLITARLRRAKLRFPDAVPEDINYREPRGLDRALLARLLTGEWIRAHQNVILVAPTGLGKSWLACAMVNQACRQGFSACYLRMPKFNEEMWPLHTAAAATRNCWRNGQRPTSSSWMISPWRRCRIRRGAICLRCSTIGTAGARRSSPARSQSIAGTPLSAIQRWLTRFSTVLFTTRTDSRYQANRCASAEMV